MPALSQPQLESVVSGLAQIFDSLQVDYAIMGGAAVCLLSYDPGRSTEDVDIVIQVDQRMITADQLTTQLTTSFPSHFGPINQYGHTIPGYKLSIPGGESRLVQLELFAQSWPERPQYNLRTASRWTFNVGGHAVKTFSPEWIVREKILSQYQRQGNPKEMTDIRDLISMLLIVVPGKPELNFNGDQKLEDALASLLQKRPDLAQRLKEKINCTALFGECNITGKNPVVSFDALGGQWSLQVIMALA